MLANDAPARDPQARDRDPVEVAKREAEKVEERRALGAHVVHEALRREGKEELERRWQALAWSGLASGLTMGLSLVAEGVLRWRLPDTHWAPLVSKLGYSAGFIAVTLGRQQLYTETTLTAILPLLHERTRAMAAAVLRLWVVVFLANIVGAIVFAWAAAATNVFPAELRDAFRHIGLEAASHSAGDAFVKGIFGGWMIALMVWLLPSAEAARIWVIALITYLLAAAQLTHIIAGSLEVMYVVFVGEIQWLDFALRYAAPTLVGNTIGGVVFVAALNHAQVSARH